MNLYLTFPYKDTSFIHGMHLKHIYSILSSEEITLFSIKVIINLKLIIYESKGYWPFSTGYYFFLNLT